MDRYAFYVNICEKRTAKNARTIYALMRKYNIYLLSSENIISVRAFADYIIVRRKLFCIQ